MAFLYPSLKPNNSIFRNTFSDKHIIDVLKAKVYRDSCRFLKCLSTQQVYEWYGFDLFPYKRGGSRAVKFSTVVRKEVKYCYIFTLRMESKIKINLCFILIKVVYCSHNSVCLCSQQQQLLFAFFWVNNNNCLTDLWNGDLQSTTIPRLHTRLTELLLTGYINSLMTSQDL